MQVRKAVVESGLQERHGCAPSRLAVFIEFLHHDTAVARPGHHGFSVGRAGNLRSRVEIIVIRELHAGGTPQWRAGFVHPGGGYLLVRSFPRVQEGQ